MLDNNYPNVQTGPPRPSKIIAPSMFSMPPGTERYVIQGSGAALINVEPGDTFVVMNDEGGQICEILACDSDGVSDTGVLGCSATGDAHGLKGLLSSGNHSLSSVRIGLGARGVDLTKAKSIELFDQMTPAKAEIKLRVQRGGFVVIAAPGGIMDLELQNTTTPLVVMVKRSVIRQTVKFELPDPLADPLADIRIHSATAKSYFVKAGDYIQVYDVDGRQCTDFQCFSARKLDKGIEHALDVTTTRTLMGHSYPMPGLHAKYYDQDMMPLLEVIQDTCGRHDAFALACAAKNYDDIGYPGHTNCSDNFNIALAEHGVLPRAGWMAINFFFNTAIDEHGAMYGDEPWSRPGDYVLLKALTDLVCVSSACPDDTTAANGWNPTDIHVRTYDGAEPFKRAIAFRATPESEPQMTKETGFHSSFAVHTRNFIEYNGYWLANCFSQAGPLERISCLS